MVVAKMRRESSAHHTHEPLLESSSAKLLSRLSLQFSFFTLLVVLCFGFRTG
jgi:hypothetical protein